MKIYTNRLIRKDLTNRIPDMKWMLVVMALFFSSCNGQRKSAMNAKTVVGLNDKDSKLSLIVSDNYSGSEESETLIIDNDTSLRKFYSKINKTRKPGLPVPEIDFSKEIVVVYCLGKSRGLSHPELYIKKDTSEAIILGVKKSNTPLNSTAETTPFSVYKMAATQKEVIIKEAE